MSKCSHKVKDCKKDGSSWVICCKDCSHVFGGKFETKKAAIKKLK